MEILVRMKIAGKRRPILEPKRYFVENEIETLRDFVCSMVNAEVKIHNEKNAETVLVDFLSEQEIQEQAEGGKVGFGSVYSEKKADPLKARQTALDAVSDGLVRIYLEKKGAEGQTQELSGLDDPVSIEEGDTVTFIRFSFLSGRLW